MEGLILVTGGTGFVGGHLLAELRALGLPVAPLVRLEVGPDTDWEHALQGVEIVVHMAALAHGRAEKCERSQDYETLHRVNALGTRRLAHAAAALGVRHFIHLSTIGVCGDETFGRPFTEECSPTPRSLYAKSKLEAEGFLQAIAAETDLLITIVRPTLVYGPGNAGNLLRLLKAIENGWPMPLGGVNNRRNLTYVGNLVSAIVSLLGRRGSQECFVVCDAEALSTRDIIRHVARGMQRPARLLSMPVGPLRFVSRALGMENVGRRLLGSLEADCTKITRTLGWRPPFSASQGLFETGAWFGSRNEARGSG